MVVAYIVILSLVAYVLLRLCVLLSRDKVLSALAHDLRRHHPVAPPGEALPHEHWSVSVHLDGYPERGVWEDSLVAYLCTDSGCSEQLSVEEVNAQPVPVPVRIDRRVRTPVVYGLPDPRRIPGNPRQIGLVSDRLTPKDGGGGLPRCRHCDRAFYEGDHMYSHSERGGPECQDCYEDQQTLVGNQRDKEDEWLWQ